MALGLLLPRPPFRSLIVGAELASGSNDPSADDQMKTYYAIVSMQNQRLGVYVSAENVPGAFATAAAKYKRRHPRRHVETIAVQEMADDYLTGSWRAPAGSKGQSSIDRTLGQH